MRRFFLHTPLLDVPLIELPKEEARHITKVLRMSMGKNVEVINGKGQIFVGKIIEQGEKKVTLQRINYSIFPKEKHHVHIAIAPTKNNARFEWFLEKATELGVHEITPLLCQHSERKKIKLERFEKIIIAATKQSKRVYAPALNPLTSFTDFIQNHPHGAIAHCEKNKFDSMELFSFVKENTPLFMNSNFPVLIGPEGDFSPNEIEKTIKNHYQSVTLGKNRLRTETAGIYACANLKTIFDTL